MPQSETDVKNIKVGLIQAVVATVVIVGWAIGAVVWASGVEKDVQEVAREQQKTISQQQMAISALIKSQERDQELLKEAAKDAQKNREALIRIEAKLEER